MQKLGTIPCSQAVTKSHELFDAVWMEKNLMTGLPLPHLKKKKDHFSTWPLINLADI